MRGIMNGRGLDVAKKTCALMAVVLVGMVVAVEAGVPLVETKGRPTVESLGWYPSTGPVPVISDRFGNGDAFSLPAMYARGEFEDMAFINLSPPPIQRVGAFALNQMELVPEGESFFTRWTVSPRRASATTAFSVGLPVVRRPVAIHFRVRNDSPYFVVLQPGYFELGTSHKWPASGWHIGSAFRLDAGEERIVRLDWKDIESMHPERLKDRGYDGVTFNGCFGVNLMGMRPGETYRLEWRDYMVEYGHAPDMQVEKLTATGRVSPGEPIRVQASVTGVRGDMRVDAELMRDERTLWRVRLTQEETHALAENEFVAMTAKAPGFLTSGTYRLGLVADGYRIEGATATVELVNSAAGELPRVEVREYKGRQAIFINGSPEPWIGHASINLQPGDISTFAEAGTHFIIETAVGAGTVMEYDEPAWRGFGDLDYAQLDERVAMVLAARPDAKLVIRPNLTMPPRWLQEHPEDLSRVRHIDGREATVEVHAMPQPAFASAQWQAEQEALLRGLVRHIKEQPWASQVIAFWLTARPHEWFFCGTEKEFWDYSAVSEAGFNEWLQKKSFLSGRLKTPVAIPDPVSRAGTGLDFHAATESGKLTAAYNQYESWLNGDVVRRFAKAVKEETDGRSLVGCHYGYLFVLPDTHNQGRGRIMSSLTALIDCPEIDFVAGVIVPKHWGLDSHDMYSIAFEALRQRGKHYMLSNDHTFYLTPAVANPWGNPVFDPSDVVRGDRYMQQRVLAKAVIHGVSPHWFGLRPTWWADKPVMNTVREMTEVFNQSFELDMTSRNEVALVVDHHGYDWLEDKARFLRTSGYLLYRTLQRTGAPLGTWLLTDMDRIPDSVKMVVVGFAAAPRSEDLDKLKAFIEKGGRTVVVIGRPGLIDTTTGEWNENGPAEALGLPIRISADRGRYALVAAKDKRVLAVQGEGAGYNSEDPWVGLGLPDAGFLSDRNLSPVPRAVVDGPSPLMFENGEGAYAERALASGGRLIWCSVPPINSALWRHWQEEAGVHFYAPLNFFVHAGTELVSVTAPADGSVEISFPEPVRTQDFFDPAAAGTGRRQSFYFDRGQTRLFKVE
jgi:hypothetical protein